MQFSRHFQTFYYFCLLFSNPFFEFLFDYICMGKGNRYTSVKPLDYCFHPMKIFKDGEYLYVACGKCDGCLLHRANSWSQRLSVEIENNPFSIFFTLTYSNKYLPTLVPIRTLYGDFILTSDHSRNIRFDGTKDVLRDDCIVIRSKNFIPIQNDNRKFTVNYFSKRDVQLWLKLLRQKIDETFNIKEGSFRYYLVSEVGPGTSRNHAHGILFPSCREVAEFLVQDAMYQNWQMCSHFLFDKYTRYCDPGTASYVSNYTSVNNSLPEVYKQAAIKPFRLSSRSPAIGYSQFDKTSIYEAISRGVITYTRTVSRINQTYILGYPAAYMSSLFPKCFRFSELSFDGLLWVYGALFRTVVGYRIPVEYVSQRLRKDMRPSDYQATLKCFLFCREFGSTPFHYLYLLDIYYYKQAMKSLASWYQWQESKVDSPAEIMLSYNNLSDYVQRKRTLSSYQKFVMETFCEQFSVVFDDLDLNDLIHSVSPEMDTYMSQVSDIMSNMDKSKKVNVMTNNSPHCI